jgi:tRNA-specific 2-thiouridylase
MPNTIGEARALPESFDATVKIRYAHAGAPATVTLGEKHTARIRLHEPQKAITPG